MRLFQESFYNWLLINGVSNIDSSNPLSSRGDNPIECTLDMNKLRKAIQEEVEISIKEAEERANLNLLGEYLEEAIEIKKKARKANEKRQK
jgi:hypothetical protein